MTTAATPIKMPGTPKPWMNTAMKAMLRTPGVRRLLGKAFAVITVTGARSGRRYTTPVQHLEVDGHLVVLSQRHRVWWRNLRTRPGVDLLVAGRTIHGHATVVEGEDARPLLTTVLTRYPRVARFYGIEAGTPGTIDPDAVGQLAERVVVIDIRPDA